MILATTLFGILLLLSTRASSKFTMTSKTIVVLAGESIVLSCTGQYLNWRFYPPGHDGHDNSDEDIYLDGKLQRKYEDMGFHIDEDQTAEEVNLVITNVTADMAGEYECRNDDDEYKSIQLVVLESNPYCEVTNGFGDNSGLNTYDIRNVEFFELNSCDMQQDAFVGPNTCGLPPDNISLSCSVTYIGSGTPVLELKKLGENKVLKSCSNKPGPTMVYRQRLVCSITMEAAVQLDGAQFTGQITQSVQRQYSNTTNPLRISYSTNGNLSSHVTAQLSDEVNCTAKCSQPCGHKWSWSEIKESKRQYIEYHSRVLSMTLAGSYRCEAVCRVGKHTCKVTPIFLEVTSSSSSGFAAGVATNEVKFAVPVVIGIVIVWLIVAVVVAGSVFFYLHRQWRRKSTPLEENDAQTEQQGPQGVHAMENGSRTSAL